MKLLMTWVFIFGVVAVMGVAHVDNGMSYDEMSKWLQDVAKPGVLVVLTILVPIVAFKIGMCIRGNRSE